MHIHVTCQRETYLDAQTHMHLLPWVLLLWKNSHDTHKTQRERRQWERETWIAQLPPVCAPPRDQTCNLGVCPDQGVKPQPSEPPSRGAEMSTLLKKLKAAPQGGNSGQESPHSGHSVGRLVKWGVGVNTGSGGCGGCAVGSEVFGGGDPEK